MQRRIDRHNWFTDYGDLISDSVKPRKDAHSLYLNPLDEHKAFRLLAYNREDNDCSVRALAVACVAPYHVAHRAMQEAGRAPSRSANIAQMMDGAAQLNCHMVHTTCTAKTLRTVERELANTHGGFIVTTSNHAAGLWNGELIDHARGRLWRLDGIFRIEPMRSKTP